MAAPYKVAMPFNLDLGEGYTLRVAAIDVATGNAVAGVNITTVVITADDVGAALGGGGNLPGDWFLVPGPGA